MFHCKEAFKEAFLEKLQTMYGENLEDASELDKYMAVGSMVRDHITRNWVQTNKQYRENDVRQVYYFSMEFLLGRLMGSNLLNMSARKVCEEGLKELGIDLNELERMEQDAGLGNGGLGRLAACFLDSLASLEMPGHGCGIRYKYGFFEQRIINGYQVELPDNWLRDGNVWEIRKADKGVEVKFYGQVREQDLQGKKTFIHENYEPVLAVPYDSPVIGYENNTVNTLRLWSAEAAIKDFDFSCFSRGDYLQAAEYKLSVESISQILYPDDQHYKGRELRLKQQYFFVSAGVQSIVRRYKKNHGSLKDFNKKICIHVNDTHPVLAIPELMRILIDEEGMGWDEAWYLTTNTISFTNHTILSEALEKWPVEMFHHLLPRIYMIVHEINERFCRGLWEQYPGDWERIRHMAIIADGNIKMAHLAIAGSFSVNGVSQIHTDILKKQEMKNFYEYCPQKFNAKTNGVTHRRWLLKANPLLSELITETIGPKWKKQPLELISLLDHQHDTALHDKLEDINLQNKACLAKYIKNKYSIDVDINSIFDVQVKRMHAYKRQLLNVLHIMCMYNQLREKPDLDIVPRTFIFGAKASPSYYHAKTTIKLINTVAEMVNNDKTIKDKLKVVFLENYGVSLAEMIFPASDVSEQISTAGKEASGTGNMKFMMNGAITVGTMDGATVEMWEALGDENTFIFGLTADEVAAYYKHGGYCPWDIYVEDQRVKTVVDQLVNGYFPVAHEEFRHLYDDLVHNNDVFFVLKDFDSYAEAQAKVGKAFKDRHRWLKMSIANIAHSGKFSSDRTISEYGASIWKLQPENVIKPLNGNGNGNANGKRE